MASRGWVSNLGGPAWQSEGHVDAVRGVPRALIQGRAREPGRASMAGRTSWYQHDRPVVASRPWCRSVDATKVCGLARCVLLARCVVRWVAAEGVRHRNVVFLFMAPRR